MIIEASRSCAHNLPSAMTRDIRKRALSIMLARHSHGEERISGADVSGLSDNLISAIYDNDIHDVRSIIQAFDIFSFLHMSDIGVVAVRTGSIDMVELLISAGLHINDCDYYANTSMMYNALRDGDLDMVRYLHKKGALFNHPGIRTCPPAYGAVVSQKQEVLDLALELGAEIVSNRLMDVLNCAIRPETGMAVVARKNEAPRSISLLQRLIGLGANIKCEESVHPPLDAAILAYWPEAVELLIKHGAAVGGTGHQLCTPIHNATRMDLPEIMEILLQHGADPNDLEERCMRRPLNLAASAEAVSLLLKYGACLEGSQNQFTPLQYAVKAGRIEVVSALLERGASPTGVTDFTKLQPISMVLSPGWVSRYVKLDVLTLLLQHGAPVDVGMLGSRMQLLSCAVINEEHDCVKPLLEYGADIDHRSRGGRNAIHHGCTKRSVSTVRTLLEHGGNPSSQTEDGWTALHFAVAYNCPDLVALLLEYGISIDKPMQGGKTALHLAVLKRHEKIVSMLLQHGAKASAKKDNGTSILHTAATQDNWKVVSRLLDSKASVDATDKRGKTPLINASSLGRISIVEKMLQHGARQDVRDDTGRTALDWAIVRGHEKTAWVLQNGGIGLAKCCLRED